MWESLEESYDCHECTGDIIFPPPIFHIPPPPIPPEMQNFLNCNRDQKRLNNLDNDMCDAMPAIDSGSFYSSPYTQALALVGVFSIILILVIIISVIFVRRIVIRRSKSCKELKSLMKNTISSKNKIDLQELQLENQYEECNHCNNYTLESRQARDFIGYTTVDFQQQDQQNVNSKSRNSRRQKLPEPENHYSVYDLSGHESQSNRKLYHLPQWSNATVRESNFQHHHVYSRPYELFNTFNPRKKRKFTLSRSNSSKSSGSSGRNRSGSGDSGIAGLGTNQIESSQAPEYAEIELVVPNLGLR